MTKSLIATNTSLSGLGNRMRFTLSALSLAEAHGREFSYAWPQTDHFRPALTDLWEFDEREVPWSETGILAEEFPFVERHEDLPANADDLRVWNLRSTRTQSLPEGATPYPQHLRNLTPTGAIRERVTSLHAEHLNGMPYVGVMIRAHEKAHSASTEASPVEWFLDRMADFDKVNPGVKFFISCDVPEVQERVIAAFPNSVGQVDKGGYNSSEGVISSVVDIYLLAASSYMIVPYYSSFPAMAWDLADSKIAMENSRTGRRDVEIMAAPLADDPLRPAFRS